jgi:hypothetical protein
MAMADDRHPFGIAVEVVVGSVSCVPLIRFRMICWLSESRKEYRTAR